MRAATQAQKETAPVAFRRGEDIKPQSSRYQAHIS